MDKLIPFKVEICLDALCESDKKRVSMGGYPLSFLSDMLGKEYTVAGSSEDSFLLTRTGEIAEWVSCGLCKVT